jgi:hypothetical protein
MSCRLHCLHGKTGYHYYLEYSDWAVALADAKRLAEAGFVGVNSVSAPAAREPGARQRETQLLTILEHVQAQAQLALERETRLLHLLEQMHAQSQLTLEREARLLDLVAQAQPPRGLDAPHPPAPAVAPGPPAAIAARAPMPQRWHVVLTYFQDHPGPQSPAAVGLGLGWGNGVVGGILRRMRQRGLLQGQAGSYELATPEQKMGR